jgi:aspartate/methionine/tyrosine aminotransferase
VPFVGPEAQERSRGAKFRARIGANESSFGPSPRVVAAMTEVAGDMWMYCDPDNHDLKVALAGHLGVGYDNVVIGEGIDGLLNLVVRMYAGPGTPVVTSLGAYPTFNFHVAGFGARLVTVPYENDRESLDGLLAAARRENARLVYLSNPDNPMGTWWEAGEIMRFIEALPETTMLVLDEAYGETGPKSALPPIAPSRRPTGSPGSAAAMRSARPASSGTSKKSATTMASTGWPSSQAPPHLPTRPIWRTSPQGSRQGASGSRRSRGQTGSPRSRRPPISSRSIAAQTELSR